MKILYETLIIFVLPIILKIFLPEYMTLPLLATITIIVVIIAFKKRIPLKALGFRIDNFKEGLPSYLLLTLFLFFGIAFAKEILNTPTVNIVSDKHFYGVFILVSFAQEFLYRSYFVSQSKKYFKKDRNIALLNALLFGLLHTIFANPIIMFFLAFIGGYFFTLTYLKHPNFWLISISHSFLNFFAVWWGLFIF